MPHLAVAKDCWFTLDREWVIADCGDGIPAVISQSVGMNIWDAFPGSEEAFRPTYEEAWANGRASAVVYWNEAFTSLSTFVRDDHLLVSLEFIPVTGLCDAIDRATEDHGEVRPFVSRAAPRLRLVSQP